MVHQQAIEVADDSLAVLYQKYAAIILAYFDRRVSIKEDAEDLLLEVFLAALENQAWTTLPDDKQLAWLYRVARNKLVDHYRRNKSHPVLPFQELQETLEEDYLAPDYLALRQEEQSTLYREIAALPPFQQEVLRLRFAYGLHTKEIAQRLKKTDAAIRNLLSRTLNHLRRSYGRQHRGGFKP